MDFVLALHPFLRHRGALGSLSPAENGFFRGRETIHGEPRPGEGFGA